MDTMEGYKLMEYNTYTREYYPLFIGKSTPMPKGKWIHAEFIPTKGYAPRGGLHIGTIPSAVWLMNAEGKYTSRRGKRFKRVWVKVAYNANTNYNPLVAKLPKKCITDGIPEDGYYIFREVGKGDWIISSDMVITGELTEEERLDILREIGFSEEEAFQPYRQAFNKRMKRR